MRALFLAIGLTLAVSGGALADALEDCQDQDGELGICSCSAVIDDPSASAENKTIAYRSRGSAEWIRHLRA